MGIGKSLRFEIFARDVFTCQYCGRRPPEVVLEVDHLHPVSKGGTDDPINLVTSCFDCNHGKLAKVIDNVAPRPDSDLAYLKLQQEIVESERYLAAKEKRDEAVRNVCSALFQVWRSHLTENYVPPARVMFHWVRVYGAECIEDSIKMIAGKYMAGKFGDITKEKATLPHLIGYIGAVLRNRQRGVNGYPEKAAN